MCGKFTQMMSWGEYVSLAEIVGSPPTPGFADRADTVAPMRDAFVVRLGANGYREVSRMRWGLVPSNARDADVGSRFIHARGETIDTTSAYKGAFQHRRGLVIVSEFYESRHVTLTRREPHRIWPDDGKPVALACIWEQWRRPHEGPLETFAIVTVAANALIAPVHDRMPAVIAEAEWPKWLGEVPASVAELKGLLRPSDAAMSIAPVGKKPPPRRETLQPDLF